MPFTKSHTAVPATAVHAPPTVVQRPVKGTALSNINWSPLIIGLFTLAATVSVWKFMTAIEKPFVIYDASLSRPYKKHPTFSVPVLMVVSVILALVQFAIAEFGLMARCRPRPLQIAHFVQAILHMFAVFWFQSFTQQLFAVLVGKQRPSFLEECVPTTEAYSNGLPVPNAAGFEPLLLTRTADCTNDDLAEDSSKAFFSGHASSAAVIILFAQIHFMYTLTVRAPPRWTFASELSFGQRLLWDLKRGLILFFMFAQFFWFLAVGMTRFTDNKHDIEDIVTGFYVGTIFAVLGVWDWAGIEREVAARSLAPANYNGLDV